MAYIVGNHRMIASEVIRSKPAAKKPSADATNDNDATKDVGHNNIAAQTFTFRELATATRNFRQECLLGEGGFGRVYKGKIDKIGQVFSQHLNYIRYYA